MPPDNPRARRLTLTSLAAVTAALPNGNSSPEPLHTVASKPTGYYMTCRSVARQGEDGRAPILSIKSTWSISKRRAPATRISPQPSSCQAYPCGLSSPEPLPAALRKPTEYPVAHHFSVRFRTHPFFIVPRPRNTHTPATIKQALPRGTSSPEPNHTAASKPTGYPAAHPFLRTFPYVSVPIRFYCAAPPQYAYPRSHQASTTQRHIFVLSLTPLRQANPRVIS